MSDCYYSSNTNRAYSTPTDTHGAKHQEERGLHIGVSAHGPFAIDGSGGSVDWDDGRTAATLMFFG